MKKLILFLLLLIPFNVNAATIKYLNANNEFVVIETGFLGISAKLNGNINIEIENLASYQNIFETGNRNSYPTYIVRKDNKYTFSDFNKDADAIYTEQMHYYDLSTILTGDPVKNDCDGIIGYELIKFLKNDVFKVFYILIPIIILVLSTFDFFSIIFSDSKDGLKKPFERFGKRVIASVLIFITPNIIILLVNILGVDEIRSCVDALNSDYNVQADS